MAEARALKRLVKTLENIKTQVQAFTANTCISDINTNLALLADEWKEYQAVEKSVKGKFDDAHLDIVEKIESNHFDIKQKLIKWQKLHELNNVQGHAGHSSMEELLLNQSNFIHEISIMNRRENEVRLPRVNIPVFSGKYSEFPSFRDIFETSIHDNVNIPKVHKLQYLKGLLKGEAYALINHVAVTEANYDEVWEKIKTRYDKQKHVVHNLLKQFMDQPTVLQGCAKAIRHLSDVSDEVLRGLKVLGKDAESRDPWLIFILLNKLDADSKEAWAHETASIDFPTLDQLFKFLNKRSDALESLDSLQKTRYNTSKRVNSLVSQFDEVVCPLCSGGHYVGKCTKFIELSSTERKQVAIDKRLCFNCLSSTHQSTVCRSRYNCRKCRRRHHILLHPESMIDEATNAQTTITNIESKIEMVDTNDQCESASFNAVLKTTSHTIDQQAILPTATVVIADKFGQRHKCRVLLDSGSQCSFISENCIQRLQLPRQRANVKVVGITSSSLISRGKVNIMMSSLYNSSSQIEISALIINKLPSKLPRYHLSLENRRLFDNMELADPDFDKPGPIDILIGADRFFAILESEQKKFDSILLQKTMFGWIVSGQPESTRDGELSSYMVLNAQLDLNMDEMLRKFWEIDEVPNSSTLTPEDIECENFYDTTHTRLDNGRYMVKLPLKDTSLQLGNSLILATQRFLSLERKLSNDKPLKEQYVNQIKEYINMGHMTEIVHTQGEVEDSRMCYLPHHSVTKEASKTTKVRVVFDGSSKTTSGISLNNRLMVGPTIQPTLWATLMRFRGHRIAITADIEKMYRQVLVAPEDTDYQRILWRECSSEKIRHYKLNRVTFGLSCSAYLAIRTLQQLARDVGDEATIQRMLTDFYVDDFLSGSNSIESASRLKDNVIAVLQKGGFILRKWRSNVKSLCEEEIGKPTMELCNSDNSSIVMVLGLNWQPNEDLFTFRVCPETNAEVTKREVISQTSRIFDPLGFLSPSIILLKILFQKLWFLKLDWDDKLPSQYTEFYRSIRSAFIYFQDVKVPRFSNYNGNAQIHGFADASEAAYCAVVYCRSTNEDGEISVKLLTSKTKVAPVKKVSLPRLELCAAHLLVKLMGTVKETIAPNAMYYAWTDSSVVLAWLSTYPARWKTFVANRTSEILEKFPRHHWAHVKSQDNPADHGSRGIHPQKLIQLKQWWQGPEWLNFPENDWPSIRSNSTIDENSIEVETRKLKGQEIHVFQTTLQNDWLSNIFQRKSKLGKIIRVVAYVIRYTRNIRIRKPTDRKSGELKAKEIEAARTVCITWVQNNHFHGEISYLRKENTVSNKSHLLSLAPFVDEAGILRVGGRLSNAEFDYDNKHQIILPSNHIFTERLIWEIHISNLHAGPTLTNNLIRQRYWIVKGRAKIRTIISKCVTCTKHARKSSSQLMGNLPIERITPARPFTNCGIDFAGPIYFAIKRGRSGTKPVKGYLCIFVCFSVKAIHIEPVSDLTSDAFLAALRRFAARRGVPENIYTDNGTNFVGARRILGDAYKLIQNINHNYIISGYLSEKGINWHFIPPASPHFGGLWESAVKSVKTHLIKSTNNVNLTFEEMATLLCQIENILNSRPLCTTSINDDYEVLTPAHFLIGAPTGAIPEKPVLAADHSLTRWQRIQSRTQLFWKKYHVDYVNNLQQRHKWQKPTINLKIGDIVLVREDNIPVCRWPLGRIVQIHPGDDTRVRVVTVKTAGSILQRPVVKICKLPVG